MDTRQKGEIARLKVQLRAAELGAVVSVPTTEVRYDAVVDWAGRLYKAQIKYADATHPSCSGAIFLNLSKGDKTKKQYLDTEVDVVLVYLPTSDTVYWFGPEVFHGRHNLSIRTAPTKSGQSKGCLMAEEHVW